MTPLLEVRQVTKSYGEGASKHPILNGIDLTVYEGEFVTLVGRSGVGKSTLLNLLAGLLPPDSGTLLLDGHPVTGPGVDRGVVFQHHGLLPWLTAYGNVRLAVDAVFTHLDSTGRKERAFKALELVHLGQAIRKFPHQLSGGMRQRVAVARTLAMEPRILLLDEPFSALDALTRGTLQEELARIHQQTGRTILMVTNDLDEAILLADRIIPFGNDGRLAQPLEVSLPHPRERTTLGHAPAYRHLRGELMRHLAKPPRATRFSIDAEAAARILPDHVKQHRREREGALTRKVARTQETAS